MQVASIFPAILVAISALVLLPIFPGVLFVKILLTLILNLMAIIWMRRFPVYAEIFSWVLLTRISNKTFRFATSAIITIGPLLPIMPILAEITMRTISAILVVVFLLQVYLRRPRLTKYVLGVLVFLIVISGFPQVIKGYEPFTTSIVFSAILAFLAYQYRPNGRIIPYIMLLILGYLAAYYVTYGNVDDAFYFESDAGHVGVSRNYVGIVLLHYYFVYFILSKYSGGKPSEWPIAILPIAGVISAGVSSTVTAIILAATWLVSKFRFSIKSVFIITILFIVISTSTFIAFRGSVLEGRLEQGTFVVSRVLLWSSFYDQLDYKSAFVGFDRETTFIDHEINTDGTPNAHNSYLNLFKKFGVFSLVYIALIAYNLLRLLMWHRFTGMIYAITLIRAFTDGYYFSNYSIDFVHLFIFLIVCYGACPGSKPLNTNRYRRKPC